ncbi:hypothetical protein HKCCE2091_15170 [Rhodobacterales bacterium HKCCE2091]|nr:hypothetical protein [Rhodobacterales bacterium HKCCE2091]
MPRRRDELTVHNERLKLLATSLNALGIGLVGFALLRVAVEDMAMLGISTLWWSLVAFALHVAAHYILGMLEKEVDDDRL